MFKRFKRWFDRSAQHLKLFLLQSWEMDCLGSNRTTWKFQFNKGWIWTKFQLNSRWRIKQISSSLCETSVVAKNDGSKHWWGQRHFLLLFLNKEMGEDVPSVPWRHSKFCFDQLLVQEVEWNFLSCYSAQCLLSFVKEPRLGFRTEILLSDTETSPTTPISAQCLVSL